MANTKVNITMIRSLKKIYEDNIHKFFESRIYSARKNYEDEFADYNKVVIKDIENYVLSKYPYMAKKLKCDYRASSASTDELTVSFKIVCSPNEEIQSKYGEYIDMKQREKDAKERLDEWEENAIRLAVLKSELPPFSVE